MRTIAAAERWGVLHHTYPGYLDPPRLALPYLLFLRPKLHSRGLPYSTVAVDFNNTSFCRMSAKDLSLNAAFAPPPASKKQRIGEAATPLDEITPLVQRLRASFSSGRTRPIAARKEQLNRLKSLVADNKSALAAAVQRDLSRHPAFTAKILGGCMASCQT